jgi:hypothetical protein
MKRLTPRKQARLLREAREILEPFGIDLSLYDNGVIVAGLDDPHSYLCGIAVDFARKDNQSVSVRIDEIWWHPDTGAILQSRHPMLLDYR